MNTNELVAALDTEISRLTQIRDLLGDVNGDPSTGATQRTPIHAGNSSEPKRLGRPRGSKNKATSFNRDEFATTRRTMSAAGKERISAAQRARWAKLKGIDAAKKSRPIAVKAAAAKVPGPSPATKRMSLPSKKPAAKPLTKSAAPSKPAPAKKTKPAKKVVARPAVKTPAKKPGVLKQVNAKSQAKPSSASINATAEEATTAAAE